MAEPTTTANRTNQAAETRTWTGFDHDDVVIIDWPTETSSQWYLIAGGLIVVIAGLCIYQTWGDYFSPRSGAELAFPLSGLLALLGIAIAVGGFYRVSQRRQRAWNVLLGYLGEEAVGDRAVATPSASRPYRTFGGPSTRAEAIAAAFQLERLERSPQFDDRASPTRLLDTLWRLGVRPPRLVLDRALSERLAAVKMTEDLLEPEPVVSRSLRLAWVWNVAAIVPFVYLVVRAGRDSILPWLASILVAAIVIRSLIVHARLGVRPGETGLVAGPGFIEWANGVRTGSWQVMTAVSQVGRRKIVVRLFFANRPFAIQFQSVDEPGFIEFWRRWNHPKPRREWVEKNEATSNKPADQPPKSETKS